MNIRQKNDVTDKVASFLIYSFFGIPVPPAYIHGRQDPVYFFLTLFFGTGVIRSRISTAFAVSSLSSISSI